MTPGVTRCILMLRMAHLNNIYTLHALRHNFTQHLA